MINIYDLTGSEQFKTLPYERKQYALNRYFTDFVSSDKRFLSLSDGEQKKAYSTFMKAHLGEPPMTPKEQAAYAQMVEADTITPEKAEQYNKQIELGRQSSDVIDIAPKLSLPKDYTPADTSKMDKESKKQYYRAAESLQIAKQLGNKESAEHWEGMLRHYKNKDEYDRTGVIISTAGQEAVRKQNLEFMASATRSDFPLEPTYPQQQLTKIKEKEAVEERKEQFYEKREQEDREQAISYQDNNRRLMRLALIKSSWTPEQNAEYGKLLKEQGEIEEYFKSGGLTPRQRDAIMLGSKAAKERNLASSMADAFFSGTLQFVTSPYTVFIPSSGISDYMYYYDMGYGSEVGAIESLFRGTVSSLPMNLMMMVNPAVGVALTMSSITSGGIKEDYEAGMLDAQTIMTNILSGAVQTAIEYMSADAQKAIYTKTFRTSGMKALQDAVHEDVKNVFFPTFKSFASAFGASAVEEGMEEIYQNVADRIIRATVNDEEMPDLKEWVPELAYEFAGGFLGAALTGTAFSAIQISQSKKMQQNITKYANQGYEYAKLTQNAIDAVNAGNYDQAFNLISQAQDAAREIGNPNKQVLQGIGTVQSAIMMYDKNKIVVTEAIIDAHEIRAKELRQELAELKKARYVNEDAALSRDARVLEIQEELVEIRDNILARQQSLVANEHVAVMKKSMDKMIEHIEANPELAEKYALQAAQAQESALLSAREISESDKAGLQAGISTEDDYRTAVDRHFTEGLADEVIEMEMKPGDFAPSRIEPYVYTDINIDESVTPKKTKEKKTDVKSEAKEDKEMAKPEPLAEDTFKTIKAEADRAIASKDKANLQKAKETLDEALKENKDQRLLDIRRSVVREIVNINEQERAVKDKEKAEVTRQAQDKAKEERKADERKSRKDKLITNGMDADIEKYRINTSQHKNKSEIADAIIEREDAVKADMKAFRGKLRGMKWEQVKDAARELKVPIKGTRAELTKTIIEAKEVQLIKDISTKETTSHERGLIKDYNEGMKPKVDEAVQKISDTVQAVKDARIDLSRETDEAKRGKYEAEISKKVEEIDSVIAELKSIQKEVGDNYIAVERMQTEINRLENVARPLSKADVTQKVDVNLSEANEMIDTRSVEKTGAIPEAQMGDTVTVSKEGYNFEITNVLVPLNEVVVSHDVDMNTNEEYPAGLQNRDRELQADAVNKISAELNPRIMMHNDIASDGRPIGFVGKDGKVYIIAGNGRTIALKMRADGRYGDLSGYEQTLKENLKKLGFQDQDVEGKILVGIYNGREDLVKLAISLNRGEGHALSETEAARTDARKMIKMDETDDGIIRLLSEKGDILSESNNKFVNAFIDEVVPDSERSKYRAKGKILVKVEERIKNALFMYVFDDDTRAAKLMSSLQATGDSNVRSMLHGIMENIKELALLKYLDPSLDFSSDLIDAVYEVDNLRKKGENLDLAQNQMDVFEDDKVKSQLLTSIYRIKSPKKAADYVKAYVDVSLRYAGDSLDFAKVTKAQVRAEFLQKWLFGEIKDMKSAKEAYIKARELTVHAPLPELEFTLYEAMAEQLAPRMGLTVDQFFAEYFDVFTTEAPTETETEASEQSIEYQLQAEGEVRYQKSKTVPKKVVQAYRMGILNEDGTLSPVMVDTKTTKPRYEIGQWYDAEVRKSTMKVIPGFHFAETPSLSQLYKKDGTLAKGRVYYIAEYSADKSYQAEADAAGGNLENQIPTDGYYFRGKMGKGGWAISGKMRPVRILSMQEVDAINRKAGIETINGMPIEKYNKMQAETRYQVPKYVREIMEVRRKYEGTDQWMKAPNGKPSKLNERQWLQVRTPAFKAWFGDWENDPKNASKVVDENGEPMVVYHGSGSSFNEFMFSGYHRDIDGYYFSSDKDSAMSYTDLTSEFLYEVFLNVRNPIVKDYKGSSWNSAVAFNPSAYNVIPPHDDVDVLEEDLGYLKTIDGLVQLALSNNHDGVIAKNIEDQGENLNYYAYVANTYVVFSPNQIKSATDNIGAYGRDTNLIRMQETVQETIKGYIQKLANGKYRVGFINADVTTGLHEQGHFGKDMLYVMAKTDPAWERYVKIAEEFCGVGEDGVWTTNAEEKFANGYVKYITEGKAPTPQLKTVFEKIKDLISKVVSKIAEIMNIELTDDIREVYGALLGAEITTKEYTRKAKVDAFITKVDAADFASKDVDVLTKRLDSEFGPQSRFITDRKLSRGKVHMNIIDIDMGNTIVNIAQVDDGYIVNGFHAATNGDAMDIVNKTINDYAPGDIDMGEKDSTRFQMPSYAREQMEVRRKYEGTDKWMKAPNGKPTNLTERQWIHVRTESFKAWFGDWENDPKNASKVVDENGEPRVVYHGTQNLKKEAFSAFNIPEKGTFFTSNKNVAQTYSGTSKRSLIYETFLNIKTPIVFDVESGYWGDISKAKLVDPDGSKTTFTFEKIYSFRDAHTDRLANLIRNNNKTDGIILDNIYDYGGKASNKLQMKASTVYVITDPNQIKSATDNVGSYDPSTPDIRYQKSNAYESEQMEVRRKYEGTDKWMKAPNGKPTNLTERQWIHVRTESFKSWFGDWENDPKNASKVVDENGEPLAVWHGTKEGGFTIFAKEKLGSNTKSPSAHKGHFFAGKESTSASIEYIGEVALETSSALSNTIEMVENAAFYATEMLSEIEARGYDDGYSEELDLDIRNAAYEYSGDHKGYEEAIVSLVENIESDLNYNIDNLLEHGYSQHDIDEAIKSLKQVSDIVAGIRTDFSFGESGESMYNVFLNVRNPIEHDYFGRNRGRSFNEIIDEGSNAGNDGAIFKRVRDGGDIDNIYVAFDNTQIKSATDNVGSYDPSTPDIRYQKSDAYESRQKFIQEQNETNAKIIREELDTAPSAEKAKEAVVNAIKRALMINYEGAEAMDVIKRREIARAIKKQQKLGNTEAVEKLKAALELMRKRDQRFRDILREETGFRNINNITLEQALKMLDRVDPVLYDRFVNESTRKVLVNSINLLESMGKKGFVYDKNTLDLFFDYFTSEHVDSVKRSGLSTLFLMPQRYLVETFGKAGQKLVELAYLGTAKRSDYEHQYHSSVQKIYDLQMTNKNNRGMAYAGEEISIIGETIFKVDGNSKIEPKNKLNAIQNILGEWAEKNDTIINMNDIEEMYRAKQEIIAIFKGFIVEFNNSEIAKLHGIQIGLIEEYGNPRIYEQEGSAKPAKDKILHVPANVKERTEVDYNAKAKHNTNLYEVYLSYATSMAKYMAFYELATYMEGNEALIPGSGEGENVTIVPAQFFRDISSIQRAAAKGALKENGYVYKYIKNVIGSNETPTSATRMFDALKTITFASTLVPSIPMTILNFHQRTLIDTQVGAEIAWQVRKDIKFFSGRGRFDSEASPTLSRIMDMYRGADTSLIAETASAAQKSATEGGRSWFAKMYYKGAEFSAKMLEASPFSKAELGNRAYAHLAGIYQIVTQTAEYKQARKEGMKFRQAVEHVLANHDNIRQAAIRNGGVVNAEINADVNPAFAPQIFWKDTGVHKYLMFVRYGITLAQLEMRKFAAPFLSMKSRQSQQIYDMLRSGNIQAADHAQYIQAAQIMLKMTDERARSKMLTEGKIDSKKMSDKRLSIQEVESFHNMIQQILDESVEVAKEKHSGVIKSTKTETLEAAQMMSFTIRELMLRTILTFVISMLPTWRKDEKEIDIIAMLSELNTYIGLFQTPQMITDFRLGGAMVPRLEYFHKDKQIIKGLTDWALRSLPGIGILNNFVKGITGKAISDDIVDAAYPSKQQKGKRNK